MYCEFYYQSEGADVGFDPEFISEDPGYVCRLVRQSYDLKTVCLPKQLEWVLNLGSDPKKS